MLLIAPAGGEASVEATDERSARDDQEERRERARRQKEHQQRRLATRSRARLRRSRHLRASGAAAKACFHTGAGKRKIRER